MMRPIVKVSKPNKQNELLVALDKILHKFTTIEGIAGIILDGGLSRGYADYLSEIDVIIYLHKEEYNKYQNTRMPFPQGIAKMDGHLYDIKILNYEDELSKELDMVALWDLSYAKIIYDPNHLMNEFINEKLKNSVDASQATEFMWEAYWNYKLAGDIWIYREDAIQGHYTLNNVIKPLLSALFIANKEYIPHDKWIIHMSKSLDWLPDNWERRISKAMSTYDFSIESLMKRQEEIAYLWNALDCKLHEQLSFHKALSVTKKSLYETFKCLIEKDEWSIREWEELSGMKVLNLQPFHNITSIEGEKVIVHRDKLLLLNHDDMYSWYYEVVEVCRSE